MDSRMIALHPSRLLWIYVFWLAETILPSSQVSAWLDTP